MRTLSRREEQIMLAILKLGDDAYLVKIRRYLAKVLGKDWTIGAIHKPLRFLENEGMIQSDLGDASPKRGGRSKRIYQVTHNGMLALTENKIVNETLWANFPRFEY